MTSSLDEEGRAFLQQRTARYGLVLGMLSGAFWLVRAVQYVASGEPNPLSARGMVGHALGTAFMLLLYAIHRSGHRSERVIRGSELVLLAASCAAYGSMAATIPLVFQPDTTILLVFATLLLTRSIYVPSDWRSTALLAAVMGVEVGGIVHLAYRAPPAEFLTLFHEVAPTEDHPWFSFAINALTWWALMGVLAASASHVIYGLRRQADRIRQLGQYTLVRKIGAGGVGVVYEATHALLRRPTAVKLLQPDRIHAQSLARFEKEVRATANLQHPNTVTVFDYGRTPDGVFYYAMELVRGATLTRVVETDGPQRVERVLSLMHQMASGLAGAHAQGLIHRDVKPDNVLVGPVEAYGEVAKLLDFGLVVEEAAGAERITRDQTIVGTPQYLAPELIRGEEPDPRCDLYALGAVGYFLLTGEHVFVGKTVVEVCAMHLSEPPEPPSARLGEALPAAVESLVLRLLSKDPADRFESALAVRDALEAMDGFGEWTSVNARSWWSEMGPDLLPSRQSLASVDTRALAVDLGRRSM